MQSIYTAILLSLAAAATDAKSIVQRLYSDNACQQQNGLYVQKNDTQAYAPGTSEMLNKCISMAPFVAGSFMTTVADQSYTTANIQQLDGSIEFAVAQFMQNKDCSGTPDIVFGSAMNAQNSMVPIKVLSCDAREAKIVNPSGNTEAFPVGCSLAPANSTGSIYIQCMQKTDDSSDAAARQTSGSALALMAAAIAAALAL